MQAVLEASGRAFTADAEADPAAFLPWLLNSLHLALTGGKRKQASVITECFQARLRCP